MDINDPIQQGAAPSAPVEGMLWLDTSLNPPVLKRWSGSEWQILNEVEVGGVNLIAGSAAHTVAAASNAFWVAADELMKQLYLHRRRGATRCRNSDGRKLGIDQSGQRNDFPERHDEFQG